MSAKTVSTATLRKMKRDGVPIAVVTAYDYPTAKLAEEAGVDVLLVGDSLGNVVLGYESTLPVTLDDMIRHTRAVTRAVTRPLVVADMPFMTYHSGADETLRNVGRLMREGRCHAVKVEGGREVADAVRAIVRAGVPVMGHIGLTPQSVYRIGGYRVQGKTEEQKQRLLDDALALEEAGAFAIVLELVAEEVARRVTSRVSVPTIGIGSGAGCDGQVLVFHDLVGYAPHDEPKRFVRRYEDLGFRIRDALTRYVDDVRNRRFPSEEESFRFESSSERSGGEAG